MAAVTLAAIGAGIAAVSTAYSISNSEQQKRLAGQAEDRQTQAANTAQAQADQEQKTSDATDARNLALSNERRRAGGTPAPTGGSAAGATLPSPTSSQTTNTITPGSGTLLGS